MNDVLPLSPTEPVQKTKSSIALPRVGFLGLGWIGRARLESVARNCVAEISVLADPTHSSLDAAREIAPQAAAVSSLEAFFEFDLDGVVIATPSALHAEQTI